MKKDVLISIRGTQTEYADVEEKDDEPIEIISPATYFFKDGVHYVFYEEVQEGTTGAIQNKITFRENKSLEVTKKGTTNSSMLFSVEEQHTSNYVTTFGDILLGITTTDLVSTIEEQMITIEATYELEVNCESYANCGIIMKIYEKELGM